MIVISDSGEKHVVFRLGEKEQDIIRQIHEIVLENNSWNITRSAKALGLQRTTLVWRIKKMGLVKPEPVIDQ